MKFFEGLLGNDILHGVGGTQRPGGAAADIKGSGGGTIRVGIQGSGGRAFSTQHHPWGSAIGLAKGQDASDCGITTTVSEAKVEAPDTLSWATSYIDVTKVAGLVLRGAGY